MVFGIDLLTKDFLYIFECATKPSKFSYLEFMIWGFVDEYICARISLMISKCRATPITLMGGTFTKQVSAPLACWLMKTYKKLGEQFEKQNAYMRVLFFKKPTFFANPKKKHTHFRMYPPNTLRNFWFSLDSWN